MRLVFSVSMRVVDRRCMFAMPMRVVDHRRMFANPMLAMSGLDGDLLRRIGICGWTRVHAAELAVEDDHKLARHIEGGQKCRERERDVDGDADTTAAAKADLERVGQDFILGPEA